MRVKAEQLAGQVHQKLQPVYLIYGDEALLVEEAADVIRQQVRDRDAEREVWHVEGRFDWTQIRWQEQSLSLFSRHRLVELRLPSGSPGKDGGQILRDYAEQLPDDTTLLIISGKITGAQLKAKWFTELDRIGVTVPIWPIDLNQLPRWVVQRARSRDLTINQSLAMLIAERVEGNLFAAAQEIDKLQLLCPNGQVDEQTVLASIADNSRFEAFGLMDTVFSGDVNKIPRMLQRLRAEGTDILAIFSAVSWSMHRMVNMALQLQQGMRLEQVYASQKPPVWEKNRPLITSALKRHNALKWQHFLHQMSQIDLAAKGGSHYCPWALLEVLCLQVAGAPMNLTMIN